MGLVLVLIPIVLMIIGIVLADDIVALEVELKELERKFDFEIKYRRDLFDDGRYNR